MSKYYEILIKKSNQDLKFRLGIQTKLVLKNGTDFFSSLAEIIDRADKTWAQKMLLRIRDYLNLKKFPSSIYKLKLITCSKYNNE